MKLTSADLAFNADGVPYSPLYDDIYHSAAGAWRQAEHVFLNGNQLPQRWAGCAQFVIVETGFGLGTNFLATWAAWVKDPQRCQTLHFVSIEKHPLRQQDLRQAWLANLEKTVGSDDQASEYQARRTLIDQLITQWPALTPGLHRLVLAQGRVTLTLAFGDIDQLLPRLHSGVDAFYLDGFAPRKNPEMWSLSVCKGLARLARTQATLATYSCAASVREHLQTAGFIVQKQPGFGNPQNDKVGKREMLSGHFAPRWQVRRYAPPCIPNYAEHSAIIIGAGVGGSAVASALARQGWRVKLFDQAEKIAQGTSAHPQAVFQPMLTRDDNFMARASRAGFQLLQHHPAINRCGVLQIASCIAEAHKWQDMLNCLGLDPAFADWVNKEQATRLSGITCAWGGIWFPNGGWANMSALSQAYLQTPGIQVQLNTYIHTIAQQNAEWCLYAQSGQQLARAPVLILANAMDAQALLCRSGLIPTGIDIAKIMPLRNIRGQLSYFQIDKPCSLASVLCGAGYILPAGDNKFVVGATYDENDRDLTVRTTSHQENWQKFKLLVAQDTAMLGHQQMTIQGGFVGQRCVAIDRLPLIGAWPDISNALTQARKVSADLRVMPRCAGLYTALALGSRGLIWSALASEILASQILGAPAPIEQDLLQALDPARFSLRYLRTL